MMSTTLTSRMPPMSKTLVALMCALVLTLPQAVWAQSTVVTAPAKPSVQISAQQVQGADVPLNWQQMWPILALPAQTATRDVVAALPQVLGARAGMALAQARAQRLQAGVHEWSLKAGAQRRSDALGERYTDSDLGLERGVRTPGKARTDLSLGALGVNAGQMAYADVWHEAVRALVQDWYEAQRARATAQVLASQASVAQSLLSVAQRRVKVGDAARIDEMMAAAEVSRALAAYQHAQGRLEVLVQALRLRYPGLVLDALVLPGTGPTNPAVDANPAPQALPVLPDDDAVWLARILASNHELELAQAEAELARVQAQRVQLETTPDPVLGVRAARERNGAENVLGVYLTLPLSGALRQADARAALAQADAASQRLALTRQSVETAARRVVMAVRQSRGVWERQVAVQQAMAQVAELSARAYALGEVSLSESLQARRLALEASLAAQAARWDALEAISRLLVDAHQLWPADEH